MMFLRIALALAAATLPQAAADELAAGRWERLHRLIKPGEHESRWTEIPWLTHLWEARRKAAAEGKPILLWEMDGNPLGCT